MLVAPTSRSCVAAQRRVEPQVLIQSHIMASKGSSGTGRSSKGAASAPSTKGPASSTPKSSVNSSRGAAQGAPSASKGGIGSAKPTIGAASSGPVSRYQVYKSYGGAQNFAHSHGLRLYNDDDVQEMKAIADAYRWEEYNNPRRRFSSLM